MNFDQNLIAPALGVLGLLIVVIIYQWITKQDGGSGAVKKIGEQIHIGAIVFMKREYKMLSIFAAVLLVLLYIFLVTILRLSRYQDPQSTLKLFFSLINCSFFLLCRKL